MAKLIDFLRLIRFPNLFIIALTQYAIRFGIIYPFLSQAGMDLFMPEKLFALLVLATVLIAASGYIINDYFDIKVDYLNRPRRLVVGKTIKRRHAMALHLVINGVAIFIAAYVAYKIGHPLLVLFQLVSAALLWFYSVTFKKQILIGNLIIASLTALVPFTAGYYEIAVMFDEVSSLGDYDINLTSLLFSIKYLLYWIIGYSIFAFLLTLIREIVKDMEDIEGDKEFGCKTLPIVYGIPKAKNIAIFLTLLMLSAIAALETIQAISRDWISLAYFFIFISLPLLYILYRLFKAKNKKDFFIISQSIKVCMLFGILYTLVIYFYS